VRLHAPDAVQVEALANRRPARDNGRMTSRCLSIAVALLLAAAPIARSQSAAPDPSGPGADLPYPPAQTPQPDQIQHVPTGVDVSFDAMMDMVSAARLVCIGETHDNMRAHDAELRVIQDLQRRFPGRIAIGMEMFREPQQPALDRWTKGELSEAEFLKATDWDNTWGMNFGYYRAILEFARDHHIDLVALNPPEALQNDVREHGIDALPPDVRAKLPEIGEPDRYEHAAMKALYGGHLPSEGMFDSFFRVQLLWEESMAARVVDYLKSPRGRDKRMVTLTGDWHVRYGFGLPKKVLRRLPLPYVVVAPTEISIPAGKQTMEVELPDIPLLPADFVWWVKYESLDKAPGHQAMP
jgi:uncharacterized iron-regulated protein